MQMKKVLYVLLALVILSSMMIPVGFAAGSDANKLSFTIEYHNEANEPIEGAYFDMYYVAVLTPQSNFRLTGEFSNMPVILNGLDSTGAANAGVALYGLAISNDIQPIYSGCTNAAGILEFPNDDSEMQPGIYLLSGERKKVGDYIYTVTPTIYYMPRPDKNGKPEYDVHIVPKSAFSSSSIGGFTDVKAVKYWKDNGFEADRPASVTALLFKDGKYYDSAILSEENGWTYVWYDLDNDFEWYVVEKLVDGYYYTVQRNDQTFFLMNTSKKVPPDTPPEPIETTTEPGDITTIPEEPTTEPGDITTLPEEPTTEPCDITTVPDDSTTVPGGEQETTTKPRSNPPGPVIPYTGLLRWPITVCSILGVLLIIIGFALIRKSRYEKNVQ